MTDYPKQEGHMPTDTKEQFISLDSPLLDGNERKYLNNCIDSNWISFQGEFVGKTEDLLAQYCETKHCLTIVNGTAALVLALQALGIGEGDEVIIPTLTMSATAFAATTVGATVVWADTVKNEFVIDPEDVARKITPKTKAVMAVHLYGRPVDMVTLQKIAEQYGIYIIEDVAEGLGALTSGNKVGGLGTIACHSFHNKIISSGEGGAITLNDETLIDTLKQLRTAPPNNYESKTIALNNRMSNVSCAVALAQLERIEELIAKRRKVAQLYDQHFLGVPGIYTFKEKENERCVYWRYQIALIDEYPFTKEELVSKLSRHNIEARPVFSLMSENPYYKTGSSEYYPNATELSKVSIDIPSSPNLTEEQIKRIVYLISHPSNL